MHEEVSPHAFHPHARPQADSMPAIAIVDANTLAAIGLAGIIHRMMPGAEIGMFASYAELNAHPEADSFYHYFVSAPEVLAGASYFLQRQHKCIVLLRGEELRHLPSGFHTLNVCRPEKDLVAAILTLAMRSHRVHGGQPEAVMKAQRGADERGSADAPKLTPREREVLCGIVSGKLNKEIASDMGVSPATVITHRKNLTEKLGQKSVSALTIYAVMHGIVEI